MKASRGVQKRAFFVRYARWCASNVGARETNFGCVSSDAFRSLFVCLRVTAKTRKKMRESRVACGSRDARKTHRTREKLRDVSDASIPSRFRAVCAHLTPVASRIARVIDTTSSGGVAILQEMRNESLKTTYLTRSFLSLQTRSLRVRRKCKEA